MSFPALLIILTCLWHLIRLQTLFSSHLNELAVINFSNFRQSIARVQLEVEKVYICIVFGYQNGLVIFSAVQLLDQSHASSYEVKTAAKH